MKKSAFMDKFGKFFRTYSIVAVLAFVFIFFSITTDAFLTPANILNIIRAVSMVGLICCGYSLVMISGGVDISTGWIMCLSMVMMTRAMVGEDHRLRLAGYISCHGRGPRNFAIMPPFIMCANQNSDNVTILRCTPQGGATYLGEVKIPSPVCIAVP